MGKISDAAKSWLRKYLIDGVSGSGENNPDKDEGIGLFAAIEKEIGAITPAPFGAKFDGVTDDTDAFNACFAYAAANGIPLVRTPFQQARIDGTLSISISNVGWDGCGIAIDRSHGTGIFLTHTGSGFDANAHIIQNMQVYGAGHAVPGQQCFELNANSNGATYRNIIVYDFYNDIYWTSYPSFVTFDNVWFNRSKDPGGADTDCGYSIAWDDGVTSGPENVRFNNCTWTSRRYVMKTTVAVEFKFLFPSFDGMLPRMFDCQSSVNSLISFVSPHIETQVSDVPYDSDNWWIFKNTRVDIDGGVFLVWGPLIDHSFFYMDSSSPGNTGISLRGQVQLQQVNTTGYAGALAPWISGGGRIRGRLDVMMYPEGDRQILTDSPSANLFPYGDFESDTWSQVWVDEYQGSDQVFSRYTGDHHSGASCLKCHFPSGSSNAYYKGGVKMPIQAGQTGMAQFWMKAPALAGSNLEAYIAIAYTDSAGNPIWDGAIAIADETANIDDWTLYSRSCSAPAPAGAEFFYFYLQFLPSGALAHDVDILLDDICAN